MRQFLMTTVIVILTGSASLADWSVGDSYKMHFPQLPDPNGLDVNFESPIMLADDWLCTETGPVRDIHFWASHRGGVLPVINGLRVEIFSNIPAPAGGFSMPGASLWQGELFGDDFDFRTAPGGTGQQGWLDPVTGQYIPNDHDSFFQINLTNITEPFIQKKGEIYWLGISIDTSNEDGWKTADLDSYPEPYTGRHFEDDAVFRVGDGDWRELFYPSNHPRGGQSIDLAFVITVPEPASLVLMLVGAVAVCVSRQFRRR
jgi:hypothetical protein